MVVVVMRLAAPRTITNGSGNDGRCPNDGGSPYWVWAVVVVVVVGIVPASRLWRPPWPE